MNYKLQVSYNTCGISGKENSDHYIRCIKSVLDQKFDSFRVVLSSCLNSLEQRKKVRDYFGNNISYAYTDELVPVASSHNYSILEYVKYFSQSDYYCYIDSGVDLENDPYILQKLYDLGKSDKYALITARASTDMGQGTVLPREYDILIKENDYVLPLGCATNPHLTFMHNDLLKEFDRPHTDVFSAYCNESSWTFLCAAIKKSWVISKDCLVNHAISIDGASSGFKHGHDLLFRSNKTIYDIIYSPEAFECGLGYEEWRGLLKHDPSKFDENGYAIDDKLKIFMKENFFLTKEQLDYDKISGVFIP